MRISPRKRKRRRTRKTRHNAHIVVLFQVFDLVSYFLDNDFSSFRFMPRVMTVFILICYVFMHVQNGTSM